MGQYVPLLFVTFLYISVFAYMIANTQMENLREDWNSNRCLPIGIILASYIPDPEDKTINRSKFSSDNFEFCIQSLVDTSIATFMIPIMAILSTQLSAANTTTKSANNLRNSAASGIANPFNSLINLAWKKFGYIMAHILRIMYQLNSSFDRIFGITISALFAGVSLFKTVKNTIDLIIRVCIIILIIIIALLFLIFIPIFPLIALLIIPAIIAISETEHAAEAGGMSGAFNCVEPGTLVKCKGGWVPVEDLKLGDETDNAHITGILYGKGGQCVSIHSVKISAMHILFDEHVNRWVFAKDHADAMTCSEPVPFVYSIVTSSSTWTVKKAGKELVLRDWTHLNSANEHLYHREIKSLLASHIILDPKANPGLGLVGPESLVWKEGVGPVPIHLLRVGDVVKDGERKTRVTSTYISSELGNSSGPNSAAWISSPIGWTHRKYTKTGVQVPLVHIGTESGHFTLGDLYIRDINEIGKEHFTYIELFLLSLLNIRNE